ncbi:MAG: adenylosuccinate lyase [Bacteroidetes bacterium CG02_land_8_20_14_3_00_31_25]|nr:adenylosuccinate lyase [Bacteroidota bacterium]PIV58435.1 MAG: adenylosuccinate lyase [Bacteroidetes bacterium CG02_land_8_20_14_3_00_31_25]PIX35464.1 MAG: adenylosuccinate lyase [Bacteroidetes bacterium CG_4_8_14_3_um_filter_31_14]PIY02558.1 MAG: adenylosuccinate lyase [Bacteroidetes bacterium CG_4_10_14_3_um_filter_31_20]
MNLSEISAISPVDGRYRDKTSELDNYFSEFALIKYRVFIEIQYFIALCRIPLPQLADFEHTKFDDLNKIFNDFKIEDALHIKEIEKVTNHDVKAVEYFLKEKFDTIGLSKYKEFIHFGLTSQDINNTAQPYILKRVMATIYYPLIDKLIDKLINISEDLKNVPMLARTHGQPASPTRFGKEIMVFVERIQKQLGLLYIIPYSAKFGGATGNFNAHVVAYPSIKWVEFANAFVNNVLQLERSQTTTQIEHYDNLAALFDNLKRINIILTDLCRDIWTYVSLGYFKQKIKEGEVGSSAMPHKINPIDFENAEGNLGIANAMFEFISSKLPISRLQRDLTDSTVSRNIGVPFAHTLISIKSLLKGLDKLIVNKETIENDLNNNWAVVAEAIQTILRRESYNNAYEELKKLTRTGEKITSENIKIFIDELNVSDTVKEELKNITPFNYTGI